jgi:hypothetical protein
VALALAVLVGCSGSDSSSSDQGGGGGSAAPEPAVPGGPEAAPDEADADRQVVTTATAFLSVEDPAVGAQEVSELVESVGGRIDQRTEYAVSEEDGGRGLSQRALLADQVELSTLTVHLEPFGVAPPGGPDGFVDGLATGWRALTAALSATVVVFGVLLPWLGLAALVAVAVLVPIRVMRRRTVVEATVPPVPPQD